MPYHESDLVNEVLPFLDQFTFTEVQELGFITAKSILEIKEQFAKGQAFKSKQNEQSTRNHN